jgi:Sulfate permease family
MSDNNKETDIILVDDEEAPVVDEEQESSNQEEPLPPRSSSSLVLIAPSSETLLLRHGHRGKSGTGGDFAAAAAAAAAAASSNNNNNKNKPHTAELERIFADGRLQTQYAVPHHLKPPRRIHLGSIAKWKQQSRNTAPTEYLTRFVPLVKSLQSYNLSKFRNDVIAGVTVSVMAIPLGMSYARLAGLPAYYGLYGSFIPPIIYPMFGSTHQLAVGPAALLSLLVSQGVGQIMDEDHLGLQETDPEYIRLYTGLAIQCSFLCAILNLAMGLFRVGFITQFLSRAVISGFISGAAVIIIFTQLQHVLGIKIPTANKIHTLLDGLIQNINDFKWQAFLLATLSIAFLVAAKEMAANEKIRSKFSYIKWLRASSPIIVSAVGIVLVWTLDLGQDKQGPLRVVGTIPSGFPDITIGQWTPVNNKLWTSVVSMVIVGFVQSISLCKRIGYRRGYEVDPSQELLALGMANLIGGIFQSYPTSGAIGQTAVNDEIGTSFPFFVLVVVVVAQPNVGEETDHNDANTLYILYLCRSGNGHGQCRHRPGRHGGPLALDAGL